MRGSHEGLVDSGHGERLQFVLTFSLRNRVQLVGKIRKQHRAKRRVACDQVADSRFRQLIGHHFLGRDKSAGDLFGDQRPAVEAIIDAVRVDDLVAFILMDQALYDDKEMGRPDAYAENRLPGTEVRDIHAVANEPLLVRAETIEGRRGKVERAGHSGRRFTGAWTFDRRPAGLADALRPGLNSNAVVGIIPVFRRGVCATVPANSELRRAQTPRTSKRLRRPR